MLVSDNYRSTNASQLEANWSKCAYILFVLTLDLKGGLFSIVSDQFI